MFPHAGEEQIGSAGVDLEEAPARHTQFADGGAFGKPVRRGAPDLVGRRALQPVHRAVMFGPAQGHAGLRAQASQERRGVAQAGEQRPD